jgi:SpoVK/Ycf46/Vps4 family AAA+-type ATPase
MAKPKSKVELDKSLVDPDVVSHYSTEIEKVITEVFDDYDKNTKLELLVVLLSFAAQVSIELGYSKEELTNVQEKLYKNVKTEIEKVKNKKDEIPDLYKKIYEKKLN